MQYSLVSTRFQNAEEIRNWIDDWTAAKLTSLFRHDIAILPERWEKIVKNGGKCFVSIVLDNVLASTLPHC